MKDVSVGISMSVCPSNCVYLSQFVCLSSCWLMLCLLCIGLRRVDAGDEVDE